MRFARVVCILCIWVTFFLSTAVAEIPCDCGQSQCTCFIQIGDEGIAVKGIIVHLNEMGYLKKSSGSMFDDEVYEAVRGFQLDSGITQTGMIDDVTLSLLLNNKPLDSSEADHIVWVPTDGGKKSHSNPYCSGMYDPRKISVDNATALGIEPCKRCNKK